MTQRTCLECQRRITGRTKNFCSEKCRSRWRRKNPVAADHAAAARPTLQCKNCGSDFVQTRPTKKFCSQSCAVRFNQKKRPAKPPEGSKPSPAANDATLRALGNNFYLPDLADELAMLRKSRGARAALEAKLRAEIMASPVWPSHSLSGQCALLLWLLDNPGATHGRFHHLFEKVRRPGERQGLSGALIQAGLGRVS